MMVAQESNIGSSGGTTGRVHVHWGRDTGVRCNNPDIWMSPNVNIECPTTMLDGRLSATIRHHGVGPDSGISVCLGDQVVGILGGSDLRSFLEKSLARYMFFRGNTLDIDPDFATSLEAVRVSLGGEDDYLLEAYLAREARKSAKRSGLRIVRRRRGRAQTPQQAVIAFILAALRTGDNSGAELYRSFIEEQRWRAEHAGMTLDGEFERAKYAGLLDSQGRLLQTAQLPYVSEADFMTWHGQVRPAANTV